MMNDLRQIIAETRRYNFHTHTQFCDGRDTLEAIALAALADGFEYLGFSPHSPLPIPSPCNMSPESVQNFRDEIKRMQAVAGDRCRIFMGMEIDYLGSHWGPAIDYFRNLGLDYSIASVHFIPNRQGEYVDIDGRFENFKQRIHEYFDDDVRYVVETFYNQSHAMLDAGGFDILGHFDKVGQNASYYQPGIEDESWYVNIINDYIDHVIASNVIVEINTKARVEHGRFFPGERYWQRLIDSKVPLMVNSDAHYADKLEASRDQAFKILDDLNHGK